jgi:uncharacterized damage-inducible protein DinB
MIHDQLKKLTQYNVWANGRIMDYIISAGEDKADMKLQSSFDTIRKTVYHIYDAETVWLVRLNNLELEYWPPSRDFDFSLVDFKDVLVNKSEELRAQLDEYNTVTFHKMCSYKNTKGESYVTTIADIYQHIMNHSTYHRGQLITMLRTAGFNDVGSTDYITWKRL